MQMFLTLFLWSFPVKETTVCSRSRWGACVGSKQMNNAKCWKALVYYSVKNKEQKAAIYSSTYNWKSKCWKHEKTKSKTRKYERLQQLWRHTREHLFHFISLTLNMICNVLELYESVKKITVDNLGIYMDWELETFILILKSLGL